MLERFHLASTTNRDAAAATAAASLQYSDEYFITVPWCFSVLSSRVDYVYVNSSLLFRSSTRSFLTFTSEMM